GLLRDCLAGLEQGAPSPQSGLAARRRRRVLRRPP
ncbi:MAG: TetR/AcrR family transcriptional regulator, partial [Mesorhizobium sp.]